ncbi:MAG: hypothetical protein ACREXY_13965 [Gammaproteobacteria bacterium]
MWYAVFADLVVLVHFLFVSFGVFGGLEHYLVPILSPGGLRE